MFRLSLIALAGCGFQLTGATDVPADADADAPIDGSPDVDSDGDGLSDAVDNCPLIVNVNQRDWDADEHGDVCDRCPHLASAPDPDGDGDGVGDACDPRPATGGDQRVIWQGFYELADIFGWRNWNNAGMWSVPGKLHQSNSAPGLTLLDSPMNYGDVYVATRMEVVVPLTSAAAEIGVCGGDIPQGTQYYCCALNGTAGKSVRATSAWSGGPGQIETEAPWPGSLAVGALVDITGTMSALGSACTFAQPGAQPVTLSTLRGPAAPGSAVFYTQITEAKYHYIFVVAVGG